MQCNTSAGVENDAVVQGPCRCFIKMPCKVAAMILALICPTYLGQEEEQGHGFEVVHVAARREEASKSIRAKEKEKVEEKKEEAGTTPVADRALATIAPLHRPESAQPKAAIRR